MSNEIDHLLVEHGVRIAPWERWVITVPFVFALEVLHLGPLSADLDDDGMVGERDVNPGFARLSVAL